MDSVFMPGNYFQNKVTALYFMPACEAVVVGDASKIEDIKSIAKQVNALGRFDSVIHNVAIGTIERRTLTPDGLSETFAVNVVAPYLLTALIHRPRRLIYLSSDMHQGGNENLDDPQWEKRPWDGWKAYSDSKLYDLALALYLARHWPDVLVNAVNPGWIRTRMGGSGAPGNLLEGSTTQAWLAVSQDPQALVSGHYFYNQKSRPFKQAASNPEFQDRLVEYLKQVTGVELPSSE
jgi:NAD(P)-dependent dehydrogenase (short-subunit alcohol dehydrogenase family)